jgi:hypothetical protein
VASTEEVIAGSEVSVVVSAVVSGAFSVVVAGLGSSPQPTNPNIPNEQNNNAVPTRQRVFTLRALNADVSKCAKPIPTASPKFAVKRGCSHGKAAPEG